MDERGQQPTAGIAEPESSRGQAGDDAELQSAGE
jgi:hypothetical protein